MKSHFHKILREFLLVLGGLAVVYLIGAQLLKKLLPSEEIIFCGMEEIEDRGANTLFKGGKYLFQSGERQDSTRSHSGKYSVHFAPEDKYGLDFIIDSVQGGEVLNITAWRYRTDPTATPPEIVATTGKDFWQGTNLPREIAASGWERLRLECTLPDSVKGQNLKIYLWNPGDSEVYFDDLEIVIWRP